MSNRYVESGYWDDGYAQSELPVNFPQTEIGGIRGGADTWDQIQASEVLWRDFIGSPDPTLEQSLTQSSRFDSANTFYAPTVGRGAVTLSPARLDNTQAFYAASVVVAGGSQTLEPELLVNETQFFGGEVGAGQASRAGFEMAGRVYIKRGRKIHIFDTVEDADAWEAAEAAAQEAIAKAKTRTAKRRIVRKVEAAIEHEVLRLDLLDALVARFNLKLDLPSIEARQDWAEYVRIAMLARELEDEEEIETLLLWA